MDYSLEETDIILNVRGQSFVVPLSTLLSHEPSYFSARFRPDSMLDPGLVRVDEQGRNVYELDRDPALFRHVLGYLQTRKLPEGIGAWAANQFLWGGVRAEAEYFGLDGLVYLLSIAFSCSPDDEDGKKNKGILYWLGTKRGTMNYLNPLVRGHVWVEGCCDDFYDANYYEGPTEAEEKAYFFQYRPNMEGEALMREVTPKSDGLTYNQAGEVVRGNQVPVTYEEIWNSDSRDAELAFIEVMSSGIGSFILSGCDACCVGTAGEDAVIISFKNGLAVSPTHHSIRNAGCYGMSGDWDFAGSADGGKTWMILHRQRGKNPLYGGLSGGEKSRAEEDEMFRKIRSDLRRVKESERKEAVCDYFEQHQRHTFKLDTPSADFFTHFRFTSVQMYIFDERKVTCLHGIGFEIWGDVREQYRGQPDSVFARIDELESQTSELLRQNAKLEYRVKELESALESQKN